MFSIKRSHLLIGLCVLQFCSAEIGRLNVYTTGLDDPPDGFGRLGCGRRVMVVPVFFYCRRVFQRRFMDLVTSTYLIKMARARRKSVSRSAPNI